MGWREDVKLGICRAGRLFTGEENGQLGTEVFLDLASAQVASEHGAGMAGLVTTYRYLDRTKIITEIHADIGTCVTSGTAQGTAIGLTGVDGCYIGRYVAATYGIVHKIEMICLETPTEGTATFEQDIDLCYTTAADVQAGEDVDVDIIAAARDWVLGEMAQTLVPKLTPTGDYLYLATGDTAGDTCVYGAGKFIVRFTGQPAF